MAEQKESIWVRMATTFRNWLDNFIQKYSKNKSTQTQAQTESQSEAQTGTKVSAESTFSKVAEYVETEKDDALLNKQFKLTNSVELYDKYFSPDAMEIDSADEVVPVNIAADAVSRYIIKDANGEVREKLGEDVGDVVTWGGTNKLLTKLSPGSFTDPELASQYWDDLANATLNSGYAGATIMAGEDASYKQTDEYKSILEDYNSRITAIKLEYAKHGIDFDQEFEDASLTIDSMELSPEEIQAALDSDVMTVGGESIGSIFAQADSDGFISGKEIIPAKVETDAEIFDEKSSAKSWDTDTGVDYSGNESTDESTNEYDGIS